MREIFLSFFRSLEDNVPKVTGPITFDQLPAQLPHITAVDKKAVPLWSPAEFVSGGTRRKLDVAQNHLAVLDLDEILLLDFERVLAPRLRGLRYLLHSTWRDLEAQARGRRRFRVILDVTRPILASEHADFGARLADWSGLRSTNGRRGVDVAAARDAARFYFVPSGPEPSVDPLMANRQTAVYWPETGPGREPLDVDELMKTDLAELRRPRPTCSVLGRLAADIKRHKNKDPGLYDAMRALTAGERYGESIRPDGAGGNRDNRTWLLAGVVARRCTGAGEDELVAVFERSIAAMIADGQDPIGDQMTPEIVRDKVRRQCQDRAAVVQEDRTRRGKKLGQLGRDEPYSENEFLTLYEDVGVPPSLVDRSWVLNHVKNFWLLQRPDREGPWEYDGPYGTTPALQAQAEVAFSAAEPFGVTTAASDARGRWKSPRDLVGDHGSVVRTVALDYRLSGTRYDPATRTLTLAPCPRREHEPEHNREIEHWLKLVFGDAVEKGIRWLCNVRELDVPSSALYLYGVSGYGKQMMATGLAQYWADAPVRMIHAAEPKNGGMLACPLLWADEEFPKDARGNPRDEWFRDVTGALTHQIRALYAEPVTLHGAIRAIISANSALELVGAKDLTPEAVEALAKRVFFVSVVGDRTDQIRSYLDGLGNYQTTRHWVAGGGICRHVEALRQKVQWRSSGRFAVEGDVKSPIVDAMLVGAGLRSTLCHWLVEWLLQNKGDAVRIGENGKELQVTARAVWTHWGSLSVGEQRKPTVTRIAHALEGLADGRTDVGVLGGTRSRFYRVPISRLGTWSNMANYPDEEELLRRAQQVLARHRGGAHYSMRVG